MTNHARLVHPMTGYRMLFIFLGFFGVVIVVNFYMAWLAVTTFSGTVVDNSYVASQQFNGWLAEARAEKTLGWQVHVALDPFRHLIVHVSDKAGHPLVPLDVHGNAGRALVNAVPVALHFSPSGAGELRAQAALPPGRWQIHLDLASGTHRVRDTEEIR